MVRKKIRKARAKPCETSARDKLKDLLPFTVMLPNLVTLSALACGISSMRWAVMGKWEWSAVLIILAAVFDGLDGRIARLLDVSSKLGAELDSLSDLVNFGVAPAFVMYLWSMNVFPQVGWALALLLAICCALRLARFNTMLEEGPKEPYWDYFFVGLPAPGGAAVAIAPLMLFLATDFEFFRNPVLVSIFVLIAALLMASRVPTICVKKAKIKAEKAPMFLLVVAAYLGFLFAEFWLVIGLSTLIYLALIPVGVKTFIKMKAKYEQAA